ncbi:MAG: TetR/AcrR family transcriptional regulator [Pseudomonadota bacterium]
MKTPPQKSNQELRTRKDLLLAAGRLVKQGRKPTMDEIAAEALVSRATAYRAFRNVDALLAEVPAHEATDDLAAAFNGDASEDAEARIDAAEAALHQVVYAHEGQLRVMLAHSIGRRLEDKNVTLRQNRRGPLIDAALATVRDRLRPADYAKLRAALALIFGTESMIVFRDVLGLDAKDAREVKSWAVRTLVRTALEESEARPKRARK